MFGDFVDDGRAFEYLDLGVQILGRPDFIVLNALDLHDDRVMTEHLDASTGLIKLGPTQSEDYRGGKYDEEDGDDVPNSLTKNQHVVAKGTLGNGLAITRAG